MDLSPNSSIHFQLACERQRPRRSSDRVHSSLRRHHRMQHPAHSLVAFDWRRSNRQTSARDRRLEGHPAPTSKHGAPAQVGSSSRVPGESAAAGRDLTQLGEQDSRVLRVSIYECCTIPPFLSALTLLLALSQSPQNTAYQIQTPRHNHGAPVC